jgi:hypothetical protein
MAPCWRGPLGVEDPGVVLAAFLAAAICREAMTASYFALVYCLKNKSFLLSEIGHSPVL